MLLTVYKNKSIIQKWLDNIQLYVKYLEFNEVTSVLIKSEDKIKIM